MTRQFRRAGRRRGEELVALLSSDRSALWEDGNHKGDTPLVPVMGDRQVFRLAVTRMPEAVRELLAQEGTGVEEIDLLVMHQANLRICEAAQKALGLPDEKVWNNIQRYDNTTSATIPLAFHEARQAGKAQEGALVAFAAGLHWGAVLMRA